MQIAATYRLRLVICVLHFLKMNLVPSFIWLKNLYADFTLAPQAAARNIYIPTPNENIKMLLTIKEFSTLINMLDAADTELQTRHMLDFFNEKE